MHPLSDDLILTVASDRLYTGRVEYASWDKAGDGTIRGTVQFYADDDPLEGKALRGEAAALDRFIDGKIAQRAGFLDIDIGPTIRNGSVLQASFIARSGYVKSYPLNGGQVKDLSV